MSKNDESLDALAVYVKHTFRLSVMSSATVAKALRTLLETKVAGLPGWAASNLTKQTATAATSEFVSSYKVISNLPQLPPDPN